MSDCVCASTHTHTRTLTCREHEKYVHDIGGIASALEDEGERKARVGGRVEEENALPTLKYHVDLLKRHRKNVGLRLLGQRRAP